LIPVSEHSHDSADDAFHEIQLSGKQLVFLFMATTVLSVVIFLCGVLVGRGVDAENDEGAESVVAGRPASGGATASDVPPPTPPPASQTPPKEGELSYPGRLGGSKPPTENLAPRTDSLKPQAQNEGATAGAKVEDAKPESPSTDTPARPATASTESRALPGTWVVQVHALRDRSAANAIVARLISKGYPAYVSNPAQNDPTAVYRVQVGRYKTRREAEQVGRRLAREEQLKPVISR
jgi:cell division septation protein DedD